MSARTEHRAEAHDEQSDERTVPTIRPRADADGCGCLDCRGIETTALRRTTVDTLVWAVRLCGRRPSIPALALGLAVAERLLDAVLPQILPGPLSGLDNVVVPFAVVIVLRAYVASVVGGTLTGRRVSPRAAFRYGLRRAPSQVGVLVVFVWAVLFVPSMVTVVLFFAAVFIGVNPMQVFGPRIVFGGVVLVNVLPLLAFLFKGWLAMEACVLGGYGPVGSLRVSWRLTSNSSGRVLVVLLGSVGSVGALAFGVLSPGMADGALTTVPGPDLLAASFGQLTTVVWYGVYAHLYVQEAAR